jgi:hypothetical protein
MISVGFHLTDSSKPFCDSFDEGLSTTVHSFSSVTYVWGAKTTGAITKKFGFS